jgi:hypothetical protein
MKKQNLVQLQIEHLLHELTCCINDLQAFRRQLTLDDVQQADISLQKLNALITNAQDQTNPVRLSIV